MTGRIDIHHHALSADVVELMREQGLAAPAQQWQLQATLDMMDAHGIQASVVSNIIPCDVLGDAATAQRLARRVNEAAAEVVRDHPSRFGFLALLPLPYVDRALEETAYALDQLGAEGVAVLPHGGQRYLGAPEFDPLFAELSQRQTAMLVHPMQLPEGATPDVPPVFADYLLDTTRAAINLITSGTLQRHPDVAVVLSHAGGFLPYAASRIATTAALITGVDDDAIRDGIRHFHYDLALSVPSTLPCLLEAADPGHILYGTDWSGVPASVIKQNTRALDDAAVIDDCTRQAIHRDNALALLPRLAQRLDAPTPATTP